MSTTHVVKCHDCGAVVSMADAHVVKAANLAGRAWQCAACGDAELNRVRAANALSKAHPEPPTREATS